jgi:hypothetical protein
MQERRSVRARGKSIRSSISRLSTDELLVHGALALVYNVLMQDEIVQLANAIHRERVERARRMPFREKFLAGGDLFDAACEVTKAGIRHDHPELTEGQVLEELRRRLARREARENRAITGST